MQTESQGVPASRGASASDHVETTQDVPPGHATVADVDQLLADGDDDDIWSDQENAAQSNGRPLYINDFLSHISPEERERAVFSQGGTQLIMRSTRQKPSPENVSLAQWITANARILAKMIQNGAMKSHDDILAYLQYNMDFGDYAQLNEHDSIMTYDHEYRRKQANTGRKWGENDIHLANFYLQRKRDTFRSRCRGMPQL
jgi:hypothetical protein